MKIFGTSINRSHLSPKSLLQDLLAGLTVSVMVVPQGMAYALLLGLPAIYGLYAAFVPLLVYPLFGSSRQLSVGPVALVSIIVLSGATAWADPGTQRYIDLILLTSLVTGLIQIVFALFKMGFLSNFLSEPVIVGFTTAAAFIIGFNQVKYILGVDIPSSNNVFHLLTDIVLSIPQSNWVAILIGGIALFLILLFKKIHKRIPSAMIVVVLSTVLTFAFSLDKIYGVDTVGFVPRGLPRFTTDFILWRDIVLVTPLALVICLISFIESLAISKTIAKKNGDMINPDKELFGLGMAKVAGAMFLAFPNTGSFARSAINDDAGAKSGMSSIFAGLIIGLIVLYFTPLFFYLPKAILGAIVVAAVFNLVDVRYARHLYKADRTDFMVFFSTCILTLFLGIQQGVFLGIIMSLFMIVRHAAKPHYAILGRLPGTNTYRNVSRYPEASVDPSMVIVRYDESIYFANADHFVDTILSAADKFPDAQYIILHSGAIASIDSTGVHKILELLDQLDDRSKKLIFTYMPGPIRDVFERSGLSDRMGADSFYLTVHDAVESIITGAEATLSLKYATQGMRSDDND